MSAGKGRNPHDLVKRDDLVIALAASKGSKAQLDSFEIIDFTSKGDNYACIVTSVKVQYKIDDKDLETSFIMKLNPLKGSGLMDKLAEVVFKKESGFYTKILPQLNQELERLGEVRLRTPIHYHSVDKDGEQVIYLEDMRPKGYRMLNRKIGMDKAHTSLILKELGRLHAVSQIFLSSQELYGDAVEEKFPILEDMFKALMKDKKLNVVQFFTRAIENSAEIADRNAGYEYVGKYLRSLNENFEEIFTSLLQPSKNFAVICHGDCWNNNFLYRYVGIKQCLLK